jgi:membrane protein
MSAKSLFTLVKDAFKDWQKDKAARLGAALAYYAIFSIGPLVLIMTAIAGLVFGEEAARGQIASSLDGTLGRSGAEMVQTIVQGASKPAAGIIATVVGAVTLLLGASGLFGQLQDSLNTIWDVMPRPGAGIMAMLKNRGLTFLMVLFAGLLLLASLVANSVLAAIGDVLKQYLPGGALIWQILGYVISLGIIILLFAMVYRFLPDVHLKWSDVWLGAIVTAVLFVLGQVALGFYLGLTNFSSTYGAASSIVVLLVWIYYSAQILFFGAEVTQVYARDYGSGIRPKQHAMFVAEAVRAEQGMAGKGAKAQKADARLKAERREPRKSPWFSS